MQIQRPKEPFYVPTKENPTDDSSTQLKDVNSEKNKKMNHPLVFL